MVQPIEALAVVAILFVAATALVSPSNVTGLQVSGGDLTIQNVELTTSDQGSLVWQAVMTLGPGVQIDPSSEAIEFSLCRLTISGCDIFYDQNFPVGSLAEIRSGILFETTRFARETTGVENLRFDKQPDGSFKVALKDGGTSIPPLPDVIEVESHVDMAARSWTACVQMAKPPGGNTWTFNPKTGLFCPTPTSTP